MLGSRLYASCATETLALTVYRSSKEMHILLLDAVGFLDVRELVGDSRLLIGVLDLAVTTLPVEDDALDMLNSALDDVPSIVVFDDWFADNG